MQRSSRVREQVQSKNSPRPRQNRGIVSMTTNQRRIALLTGASIAALGIAGPAFAAPRFPAAAPHDAAANGSYAGTNVVALASNPVDEIVICDIGSPDPDPCFFGETLVRAPRIANSTSAPTGCNSSDRGRRRLALKLLSLSMTPATAPRSALSRLRNPATLSLI